MTRTIPGNLTLDALKALHGHRENPGDADRMAVFHALTREQQAQAIRRLAAMGQSETTIARATGLSVEFIKRVIAERGDAP